MIREQHPDDYEAIRHVYAEAFSQPRFRPPQGPGCVPPEVGLFEALWHAGDVIAEFSFTALDDAGVVVGHVTASNATVATDAVVAPAEELGVLSPEPEWGDAFQARRLSAYTGSPRRTVSVRAGLLVLASLLPRDHDPLAVIPGLSGGPRRGTSAPFAGCRSAEQHRASPSRA